MEINLGLMLKNKSLKTFVRQYLGAYFIKMKCFEQILTVFSYFF